MDVGYQGAPRTLFEASWPTPGTVTVLPCLLVTIFSKTWLPDVCQHIPHFTQFYLVSHQVFFAPLLEELGEVNLSMNHTPSTLTHTLSTWRPQRIGAAAVLSGVYLPAARCSLTD